MRKLKLEETKRLVSNHTTSKWERRDLNLGLAALLSPTFSHHALSLTPLLVLGLQLPRWYWVIGPQRDGSLALIKCRNVGLWSVGPSLGQAQMWEYLAEGVSSPSPEECHLPWHLHSLHQIRTVWLARSPARYNQCILKHLTECWRARSHSRQLEETVCPAYQSPLPATPKPEWWPDTDLVTRRRAFWPEVPANLRALKERN